MSELVIPIVLVFLVLAASAARRFMQASVAKPLSWVAGVGVVAYLAVQGGPLVTAWAIAALDVRIEPTGSEPSRPGVVAGEAALDPVRVKIYAGSLLLDDRQVVPGADEPAAASALAAPGRASGSGAGAGDARSDRKEGARGESARDAAIGSRDDPDLELSDAEAPDDLSDLELQALRRASDRLREPASLDPDSDAAAYEDPASGNPDADASDEIRLSATARAGVEARRVAASSAGGSTRGGAAGPTPAVGAPPRARSDRRSTPAPESEGVPESNGSTRVALRERSPRRSARRARDESVDPEVALRTRASLLAVQSDCRAADLLESGRAERTLALARVFRERCGGRTR